MLQSDLLLDFSSSCKRRLIVFMHRCVLVWIFPANRCLWQSLKRKEFLPECSYSCQGDLPEDVQGREPWRQRHCSGKMPSITYTFIFCSPAYLAYVQVVSALCTVISALKTIFGMYLAPSLCFNTSCSHVRLARQVARSGSKWQKRSV